MQCILIFFEENFSGVQSKSFHQVNIILNKKEITVAYIDGDMKFQVENNQKIQLCKLSNIE